jgi:hypothetical protein
MFFQKKPKPKEEPQGVHDEPNKQDPPYPSAFGPCGRCGRDCILLSGLCFACERKNSAKTKKS